MLFFPPNKCIIFWHDILIGGGGGGSYQPEQYRKTLESLEAL